MQTYSDYSVNSRTDYHWGLCILRCIMCFEVVLNHFWQNETQNVSFFWFFSNYRWYAVPIFFIISFYLLGRNIRLLDNIKLRKRLWRLYWPLLGWSIIIWLIYNIENIVLKRDIISVSGLFWQLITGYSESVNISMWYQVDILIITIFVCGMYRFLGEKKAINGFWGGLIISFVLQYSGVNHRLWRLTRYEILTPGGRLLEMLPYAIVGVLIAVFGIDKALIRKKLITASVCILLWMVAFKLDFLELSNDFCYGGLKMFFISVATFVLVLLFPLTNIPIRAKAVIQQITSHTLGIYCIHRMVAHFVLEGSQNLRILQYSFTMCVVVYVICYVICEIISIIPSKLAKGLVD